jgi:hypothetical protein
MSACQFCEHPTPGLHNERCPHIGVRLGGADDAIHIVVRRSDARTLCDLYAPSRNAAMLSRSHDLDAGSACWTCIGMRRAALSEHLGVVA